MNRSILIGNGASFRNLRNYLRLRWDLEMHVFTFIDTKTSINFCLTEKKRKMLTLFVEDRFMINEFKRIGKLIDEKSVNFFLKNS